MGVAYDGDADRCLAVDTEGDLVDGDQIMGLLAVGMKADGTLGSDTLVVTVMSNLGLILAMREHGIRIVQTGVGDRYVLEKMLQGGFTLGGEQSGHVIDTIHATTGDGVLTSLRVAARLKRTGRTLAELASIVTRLPQTLVNVKGVDKASAGTDPAVQDAVAAAEAELGETGRVLLRPSGTEPLVRIMSRPPLRRPPTGSRTAWPSSSRTSCPCDPFASRGRPRGPSRTAAHPGVVPLPPDPAWTRRPPGAAPP